MVAEKDLLDSDPEITAIGVVHKALRELDPSAQKRVLDYVAHKLGLSSSLGREGRLAEKPDPQETPARPISEAADDDISTDGDDTHGISSVAIKWMKRSGFSVQSLSALFSLGVDDIDLVAKDVPGSSKRERMHSVLLLKGIAAYLGTGAARISHEQMKEACLHYDAFDTTNAAKYLKGFAPEVSGTKESGYTLTARGLTSATEIIRSLTTRS